MSECMTQEDAMNMSNEQAIQILKPLRDMMIDQHGCPISSAVFALDKAIKALSAQQWIPCGERLPEEKKEVLISAENGLYIAELEIINGREYWSEVMEYRYIKNVEAWMPLPEPYRERRTDEAD